MFDLYSQNGPPRSRVEIARQNQRVKSFTNIYLTFYISLSKICTVSFTEYFTAFSQQVTQRF